MRLANIKGTFKKLTNMEPLPLSHCQVADINYSFHRQAIIIHQFGCIFPTTYANLQHIAVCQKCEESLWNGAASTDQSGQANQNTEATVGSHL